MADHVNASQTTPTEVPSMPPGPSPGRVELLENVDLAPDSLVGSWFHTVSEDGVVEWQGQVVGEPQPGIYLCHVQRYDVGAENIQILRGVLQMAEDDWRFYDSETDALRAFQAWVATEKERT